MGAAESPDRKRRRHDSRERHRQDSRDRLDRARGDRRDHSRERGSHRGREAEGSTRHKQGDYDPSDRRDRPGTTSGRGREQEHVNGRGGSSRQASPGRPRSTHDREREQDRRTDGSRDRSREWHHDRDRERDRERQRGPDRDREGQHETHRRGDRDREKEWDRDRGGTDKGGRAAAANRDDRPSSRGDREGREMDRSRGPRPEQQQERFAEPPRRDREHSHRDTGGAAGSSRQQQQQRRDQPPEGKPKWGKPEEWAADEAPPPSAPKEAPNMGLSGKLAAETNKTADGTAELKFQAPAEARVCKKPVWKLFVYKGQDAVGEPIPLTQLPFYMFGKDRKVADIPTDHPSCSRQHAVLVFREVEADAPDGIGYVRTIKPYLLDLETTNGTTINKERLEAARYYELLSADVIRFGFSSRDYVIMNEAVVQ